MLSQHLYMALLLSARILAGHALGATRALTKAGLSTPQKMAVATWQDRVNVITWHGSKRYDERTSLMLGDTAALLLDGYKGDVRNLRTVAGRDVKRERPLLQSSMASARLPRIIFFSRSLADLRQPYPYRTVRFSTRKAVWACQAIRKRSRNSCREPISNARWRRCRTALAKNSIALWSASQV